MSSVTAGVGSGGAIRIDVTLVSQNQAGNYSTVNVKCYMINNTGTRSFNNGAIAKSIYGSGGADGTGPFNVLAHSEQLVMNNLYDIGHDAAGNGSSSFGFHLGATGTTTFGGGGDAVPANDSWPRIPKPPDPPVVGIVWLESTRAGIYTAAAGAENGATTDGVNYRVHRVSDGAWMGDLVGGYGGVAFPGLARNTAYNAYGQSHNVAGWGGFGGPTGFTTLAEAPSSPGTEADTIQPTSARIVVIASTDNGGAGIDAYEAYVMTNNAFPGAGGTVVASAGGGTFTTPNVLVPSTQYFYTARARNTSGYWSAWTPMKAFTTLPAALVKSGGVYKNAVPYIKVAGVYTLAVPYKKVAGVYKQ